MNVVIGALMLAVLYASATAPPEEHSLSPSIQEVKTKHADALMQRPGVLSVGIGRSPQGDAVIVIGVDRQYADKAKSLPTTLEGYAVRVELMGTLKAQ